MKKKFGGLDWCVTDENKMNQPAELAVDYVF